VHHWPVPVKKVKKVVKKVLKKVIKKKPSPKVLSLAPFLLLSFGSYELFNCDQSSNVKVDSFWNLFDNGLLFL